MTVTNIYNTIYSEILLMRKWYYELRVRTGTSSCTCPCTGLHINTRALLLERRYKVLPVRVAISGTSTTYSEVLSTPVIMNIQDLS
jgi:hypothetical protein